MRHLLITKFGDSFFFTYNGNLIQRKEENSFTLKTIIQNDSINLITLNFNFIKVENFNQDENIDFGKNDNGNNQGSINNSDENKINNEENNEIENNKNKEINDKMNEKEYEIINNENDNLICKIKILPEMTLTELREKLINLIPKRTKFVKGKEIIEPSKEDSTPVKKISDQNKIFVEPPEENKNDTMEIEIFVDGKSYIKKQFYITIKLKSIRTNLKFDESSYKIIYKGNLLSIEEENKMTLDELCYKELKILFMKVKNNNNHIQKLKNLKLEKQTYNFSFKENDKYETWIILGLEKSGKTTFINCLLNYCLNIKFEDKNRYFFKEKKKNNYEIYDIEGESNKIRMIEFPGFSGEKNLNESIRENIENLLKKVKEIKIICFIIDGNTTRLIEEIKIIFLTFLNIFGDDIKSNFIFLFTHCDVKEPPVLNLIKNSIFSKILPQLKKPWFFKFNNSYLFETIKKDFWDLEISHYDELINDLKERNYNTLQITKKFIDLKNSYEENKEDFITSLHYFQNLKEIINILYNIDYYIKNNFNQLIPFEHKDNVLFCSLCNKIPNNLCTNHRDRIKNKIIKKNEIHLLDLYNNKNYYDLCINQNSKKLQENFKKIANLYQQLSEYYEFQLNKNDTLLNDLKVTVSQGQNDGQKLWNLIMSQEKLYNEFKKTKKNNFKKYQDFINSLSINEIMNN